MVRLGESTFGFHCSKPGLDVVHLRLREQRLVEALDVVPQARTKHVLRHGVFELAFPDEEDDGVKHLSVQVEETSETFDMAEVLVKRVLKPGLVPVDALTPSAVLLPAKNPTLHVLRLNDENAEGRNQHVVNLRRAVGRREDDVVNAPVNALIQTQPHAECRQFLAEPAFDGIEH